MYFHPIFIFKEQHLKNNNYECDRAAMKDTLAFQYQHYTGISTLHHYTGISTLHHYTGISTLHHYTCIST